MKWSLTSGCVVYWQIRQNLSWVWKTPMCSDPVIQISLPSLSPAHASRPPEWVVYISSPYSFYPHSLLSVLACGFYPHHCWRRALLPPLHFCFKEKNATFPSLSRRELCGKGSFTVPSTSLQMDRLIWLMTLEEGWGLLAQWSSPSFRLICSSLCSELTWACPTLQPRELNWGREGQHKGEGEVASPLDHTFQPRFALHLIFVS